MLSERKKKILKLIIDEFTENSTPVGSKSLINKYNIPYSSATIRNEMLNLETKGLLQKTHTSSGRIPSEDGYRFYIEELINLYENRGKCLLHKDSYLDNKYKVFEELTKNLNSKNIAHIEKLKRITKHISEVTKSLTFYIGPEVNSIFLEKLTYINISNNNILLVLTDSIGRVLTKNFYINSLKKYKFFGNLIGYLDELLKGESLDKLESRFEDIKNKLIMYYEEKYDFYDELKNFFYEIKKQDVFYLIELKRLFLSYNYENTLEILNFFEKRNNLRRFKSNKTGIDIKIGEKIGFTELKHFSLIILTLNFQKNDFITLGIIGDKRMPYNDIIQLMMFIKENYNN